MASSVAKLKQITRRKTRHGEWANGRPRLDQLQRNNGRASTRPPFSGRIRFGSNPGLKLWAKLFCHFVASAVSPSRPFAHSPHLPLTARIPLKYPSLLLSYTKPELP
jgi:hypothetical protein